MSILYRMIYEVENIGYIEVLFDSVNMATYMSDDSNMAMKIIRTG